MLKLVPPDTHFLSAAIGWMELGNAAEAKLELEKLSESVRDHPDVLEIEWLIHSKQKDWTSALKVAQVIVKKCPEQAAGWLHQAYALRRVETGGLLAAWNVLSSIADKFPNEPTLFYNLSCYACQMDRLDDARQLLQRAMRVGDPKHLKKMALADEDLRALWDELRKS